MRHIVKIKHNEDTGDHWRGREGVIIAIVKDKGVKEYIIQFKKPSEWSYFRKNEFKLLHVEGD